MSEEDDDGSAKALATEIRILRARRMLRTLGLVQDLAGGCRQGLQESTAATFCWVPRPSTLSLPRPPIGHPAASPNLHQTALPTSKILPPLAADLVMVLADVRQSKGLMSHAAVLSLAGLVSGCLSAYKNWPGAQR